MTVEEKFRSTIIESMKTLNHDNINEAMSLVDSMCEYLVRQQRVSEENNQEGISAESLKIAISILKEEMQNRIKQLTE